MSLLFRFQTLLDYRNRLVDDRQLFLSQATETLLSCRSQVQEVELLRSDTAQALQRAQAGHLEIGHIDQYHRYLRHLDDLMQSKLDALRSAEVQVAEAREALATALREKKTLEKLREYDEKNLLDALTRKEREELDELNIGRYLRLGRATGG